jgi:isopenicillin N synthase-like dioxygenase
VIFDRYKAAGVMAVDASGEKDTIEILNIRKDDAFAWPAHVHRTYPEPVDRQMTSIVRPFVEKSMEVNRTIIGIFNDKLGLPHDTLLNLHPLDEHSGCEARILKNPPMPHNDQKTALGAHTDFGSLASILVALKGDWKLVNFVAS